MGGGVGGSLWGEEGEVIMSEIRANQRALFYKTYSRYV